MKDPLWDEVWEELGGVCVMCLNPASSIHEVIPRSKLPNAALLDKNNRVTLCTPCHTYIENHNPGSFAEFLRYRRAIVKDLFS